MCRENLAYAAHLRQPRDVADRHRRAAIIDDALDMLQLKPIQHYRWGLESNTTGRLRSRVVEEGMGNNHRTTVFHTHKQVCGGLAALLFCVALSDRDMASTVALHGRQHPHLYIP